MLRSGWKNIAHWLRWLPPRENVLSPDQVNRTAKLAVESSVQRDRLLTASNPYISLLELSLQAWESLKAPLVTTTGYHSRFVPYHMTSGACPFNHDRNECTCVRKL
ncbi:hypothetical protein Trydic_g21703 [Trypoxylus dichotomus]